MKRTPLITASLASLYALALALPSPVAHAADAERNSQHNAAGMCVPATFLVSRVRNRPSGLRNESAQTLYVTCTEAAGYDTTGLADYIVLDVANYSNVSVTINCTLFTGFPLDGSASTSQGTYPMSLTLTPNQFNSFEWDSTALTGTSYSLLNASWSCSLPPDAEIRGSYRGYNVDVGS